jgi:hypothetical protein
MDAARAAVINPGVARTNNHDDDRAAAIALHPAGSALRADTDPDGGICQW